MCLNAYYYPLARYRSVKGEIKKKILFHYGVQVIDDTKVIPEFKLQLDLAKLGLSKFESLNDVYRKEQIDDIEKMVSIPCGRCAECLKQVSREWACRIMLETKEHKSNYFVTLTYDDEHLPENGFLDTKAISDFNKKLKVYLKRNDLLSTFRFYGVGEYGSKGGRPHYHVIYFGLEIPDLKPYRIQDGNMTYTSEFLNKIWANGYVVIGSVTPASACYVARYCDKKKRLTKQEKQDIIARGGVPEFSRMSNRPGIGGARYDDIVTNIENDCFKIVDKSNVYSIPRYFIKKIEADENKPINYDIWKEERLTNSFAKLGIDLYYMNCNTLHEFRRSKDHITKRKTFL